MMRCCASCVYGDVKCSNFVSEQYTKEVPPNGLCSLWKENTLLNTIENLSQTIYVIIRTPEDNGKEKWSGKLCDIPKKYLGMNVIEEHPLNNGYEYLVERIDHE